MKEERIWPGLEGPEGRGDIRDLRLIGKHLFATGMGRQVYRRVQQGTWERFDAGVVVAKPSLTDVHGFNSIDGTSEQDLYAAGFGGEMWRYDGKRWRRIDIPTNLLVNRVRAVAPDRVIVVGKKGLILRGHGDEWEVVDHGETDDEIWDVETFGGHVYVATDDALYLLTDDDRLEAVDMGFKRKPSCGSLHANDGVLLSVGTKHVCWTDDGKKWHDITP